MYGIIKVGKRRKNGKLDKIYSSIMCLPTNPVVKRNIKEMYNKNPESELLSNLAGKK